MTELHRDWIEEQARGPRLPQLLRQELGSFRQALDGHIEAQTALIREDLAQDRAPKLTMRTADPAAGRSLLYWDRSAELIGREASLAALDQFIEAPDAVLWTVVSGPAGAGKSRLVYEALLLRRAAGQVEAGFLDPRDGWLTNQRYRGWNAPRDTVLVIDYAGLAAEPIRTLIDNLASRPPEHTLAAKVRLILIDTLPSASEFGIRRRIIERSEAGFEAARHEWRQGGVPLDLGELSTQAVLRLAAHYAERALTAAEVEKIKAATAEDSQLSRPLFAALMGQAARDGMPGRLSSIGVTELFLERHRERWKERGIPAHSPAIDHRLLAVATIAGSCAEAVIDDPDLGAAEIDAATLREHWCIMAGSDWHGAFEKLEPDFAGGLYVLQSILGCRTPSRRAKEAALLMRLAWRHGHPGEFLVNLARNFGGDPAYADWVAALAQSPPPEDVAAKRTEWAAALVQTVFHLTATRADDQADCLLDALEGFSNEDSVRPSIALAIFAAGLTGEFPSHPGANDRLSRLRSLAAAYPEDAVREWLAKGLFNTIYKAASDAVRADALLGELRRLAVAHPEDVAVREWLAKGLFNAFNKARLDAVQTDALLDELRRLAVAYPEDATVREQLAGGLVNSLHDAGPDAVRADAPLDELRRLAAAHPEDAPVREKLATGLVNALYHAGPDAVRADALLGELRRLAVAYAENATVRKWFAGGLYNALNNAKPGAVRADALLGELRRLAVAHPEDAAVRERLAQGLFNALYHAGPDAIRADALLDELRRLAVAHPEDAVVREQLAGGLVNALHDTGPDAVRADALLDELRRLTVAHPEDTAVREILDLAERPRPERGEEENS